MNIAEMHVWFRQYAQQMGMQNVRAILPEQIDILINTSITDIVNQLIRENIGLTNDRIITDNSKLGQINAFRTLYKVVEIDMSPKAPTIEETRVFNFSAGDRLKGRMTTNFAKVSNNSLIPNYLFLVDFSLSYKQVSNGRGYSGTNDINTKGTYSILTPHSAVEGESKAASYRYANIDSNNTVQIEVYDKYIEDDYVKLEFMLQEATTTEPAKLVCISDGYYDEPDELNPNPTRYYLAVEDWTEKGYNYYIPNEYKLVTDFTSGTETRPLYNPVKVNTTRSVGYVQPSFKEDGLETNYFPVRLIDDVYLADTLNDFVLKNRLRSPILVTYNNGTFDLYIDKFKEVKVGTSKRYVLENNLIPYKFRMSYIAKPAVVKYAEDLNGENVDCDLPESMHVDILKHAVDLYNIAIQGSLYATQQQQQAQNREIGRNQVRPDNEGYQS